MTNKNMHWNKPFLLCPAGKETLWGGQRLNTDFAKNIPIDRLGETWECSTHPMGQSVAACGEHKGKTLSQILREHPEYAGTHPNMENGLPLLVKLIDADEDLSIQVHPNDEYAKIYENGQWGKTEMWYVLDAAQDAKLIYGLSHQMSKEEVRESLEEGTFEKHLQKTNVKKGDVFFINAGTIHGIGKGILLAEIQQSSDLTYRLYDYDRIDKNGNKRELHIKKALDVANLDASTEPKQPMRVLKYRPGWASEFLCRCKYFQVERVILNTERIREMVDLSTDELSFSVFLCIEGCGTVFGENMEPIRFFKGDCLFAPANSIPFKIHGFAQLLQICC